MNRVVSANELTHIPVTYQGTNYQPVLHREAIETIKEYLDKHNFKITNEMYLTASNGQRVIGRYGIQYDNEFDYMIGFANSHDGSIAFKFVEGSIVRACSNGNLWSDGEMFKRKHVGSANIDIVASIEQKIHKIESMMKINEINAKRMKEIEVGKETISKLVGQAYLYDEIIRANQLSVIKKELETPSFDYGVENSLWNIYNGFTHAIKSATPTEWVSQHVEVSDYFVNAAGILERRGEIVKPATLLPKFELELASMESFQY